MGIATPLHGPGIPGPKTHPDAGRLVTKADLERLLADGRYLANWCWKQRIGPKEGLVDKWMPDHHQLGVNLPPELGWEGAWLFMIAETENDPSGPSYLSLILWRSKQHFRDAQKHESFQPIFDDMERIGGNFWGDPDFTPYPDKLILLAGSHFPFEETASGGSVESGPEGGGNIEGGREGRG